MYATDLKYALVTLAKGPFFYQTLRKMLRTLRYQKKPHQLVIVHNYKDDLSEYNRLLRKPVRSPEDILRMREVAPIRSLSNEFADQHLFMIYHDDGETSIATAKLLGWKQVSSEVDVVIFCDSDCLFFPGSIQAALEAHAEKSGRCVRCRQHRLPKSVCEKSDLSGLETLIFLRKQYEERLLPSNTSYGFFQSVEQQYMNLSDGGWLDLPPHGWGFDDEAFWNVCQAMGMEIHVPKDCVVFHQWHPSNRGPWWEKWYPSRDFMIPHLIEKIRDVRERMKQHGWRAIPTKPRERDLIKLIRDEDQRIRVATELGIS